MSASASQLQYHKNRIYQHIDEAISMNDLLQMLQFVELQTIKNAIKQQVKTMSSNSVSNIFHSSLSIESILPIDLIQTITSFNNLSNVKAVSKTFNKCYKKNQDIQSKQTEQKFLSEIQTKNKEHNTWIVDKSRTKLNNKEISLKYKGPINNFPEAIQSANSGDLILIYDGNYNGNYDKDYTNINKSLRIIGCGSNVLIQDGFMGRVSRNLYVKNVKFKINGEILIEPKCHLVLDNCDVMMNECLDGVTVSSDSSLTAINCNFYATSSKNDTCEAIWIADEAKEVNLISCQFAGFCQDNYYSCIYIANENETSKMKFIDNVIKLNNGSIPIGKNTHNSPHKLKNSVFQHNKLEYDNLIIQDVLGYFLL